MEKYNKLELISSWLIKSRDKVLWKCECWNKKEIRYADVKYWNTKSCWCLQIKTIRSIWKNQKTHWMSNSKIYKVYDWIKRRCENKSHRAYKNYWGRWIKCEWNTFEEFFNDIGYKYKHWIDTIDRINNDWHYCKDNCRLVSMWEQNKNRKATIMFTYNWRTMCLKDWCKEFHLKYVTIQKRIQNGWDIEKALFTKINNYVNK